jgi:hypothetical protein
MLVRMKLTKRTAARRHHRSILQQAPGIGLPTDVVTETVAYLRERGVAPSTIAELFRTTVPTVRGILARHRLAAVHLVKTDD